MGKHNEWIEILQNGELIEWRVDSLEKFFQRQFDTLSSRSCSKNLLSDIEKQRKSVIKKAIEIGKFQIGEIPFIAVIPRREEPLLLQMKKYFSGGKKFEVFFLDPKHITNLARIPTEAYFMFGVRDGRELGKDKKPFEAEKLIRGLGRSGLTAEELVAICLHTSTLLLEFSIYGVGSRYDKHGVPVIYKTEAGNIQIGWRSMYNNFEEKFFTASCGKRLTFIRKTSQSLSRKAVLT